MTDDGLFTDCALEGVAVPTQTLEDPERVLPPALLTDLAGLVARPAADAFLLLLILLLLLVDLAGLGG